MGSSTESERLRLRGASDQKRRFGPTEMTVHTWQGIPHYIGGQDEFREHAPSGRSRCIFMVEPLRQRSLEGQAKRSGPEETMGPTGVATGVVSGQSVQRLRRSNGNFSPARCLGGVPRQSVLALAFWPWPKSRCECSTWATSHGPYCTGTRRRRGAGEGQPSREVGGSSCIRQLRKVPRDSQPQQAMIENGRGRGSGLPGG